MGAGGQEAVDLSSANLWYGLIANGFGNTSNGWSDRDFNHQRKELKIKAIPVIALPWTQN
jgi:hypothetical protein